MILLIYKSGHGSYERMLKDTLLIPIKTLNLAKVDLYKYLLTHDVEAIFHEDTIEISSHLSIPFKDGKGDAAIIRYYNLRNPNQIVYKVETFRSLDYWCIKQEIITAYEALKFKDSGYAFFSYEAAISNFKEKLESERIEIESKIIGFRYNLKTIDKLLGKLQ